MLNIIPLFRYFMGVPLARQFKHAVLFQVFHPRTRTRKDHAMDTREALRRYLDARLDHTVSDQTAIEYADALASTLLAIAPTALAAAILAEVRMPANA